MVVTEANLVGAMSSYMVKRPNVGWWVINVGQWCCTPSTKAQGLSGAEIFSINFQRGG